MKIISIEKTAIDNFMKTWPCSGLHKIDHILTAFDDEGNLVDMDAFNDVLDLFRPHGLSGVPYPWK